MIAKKKKKVELNIRTKKYSNERNIHNLHLKYINIRNVHADVSNTDEKCSKLQNLPQTTSVSDNWCCCEEF